MKKPKQRPVFLDLQALFSGGSPAEVMQETLTKVKAAIQTSRANIADRKAGILPDTPTSPTWTRIALVLPVLEIECKSCGTHVRAPAGPLMVKSTNPRQGTRLTPASPGTYSPDMDEMLPRELAIKYESVSDCPRCFDLCNRLYEVCNGFEAQTPRVLQMKLFQ